MQGLAAATETMCAAMMSKKKRIPPQKQKTGSVVSKQGCRHMGHMGSFPDCLPCSSMKKFKSFFKLGQSVQRFCLNKIIEFFSELSMREEESFMKKI